MSDYRKPFLVLILICFVLWTALTVFRFIYGSTLAWISAACSVLFLVVGAVLLIKEIRENKKK